MAKQKLILSMNKAKLFSLLMGSMLIASASEAGLFYSFVKGLSVGGLVMELIKHYGSTGSGSSRRSTSTTLTLGAVTGGAVTATAVYMYEEITREDIKEKDAKIEGLKRYLQGARVKRPVHSAMRQAAMAKRLLKAVPK